MRKQPEQALAEGERALALNPNYADGYVWLGHILSFQGKPKEALGVLQQALRLNPHPPFPYFGSLGIAYYLLRRNEESIVAYQRALALNPHNAGAHAILALNFIETGQEEAARAEFIESLKLSPLASPRSMRQRMPMTDPAVVQRMSASARKALATLRVRDYVAIVKARVGQYFRG